MYVSVSNYVTTYNINNDEVKKRDFASHLSTTVRSLISLRLFKAFTYNVIFEESILKALEISLLVTCTCTCIVWSVDVSLSQCFRVVVRVKERDPPQFAKVELSSFSRGNPKNNLTSENILQITGALYSTCF